MESLTRTVGVGAAWNMVGTVGVKLVGLATMFLILSNLSVEEFGRIELVMSIPPLLSMFLLPGLSTVVMADMGTARSRNDFSEMKRLFHGYFRIVFALSLVAWAIVLAIPHLFMGTYDPSVRHMIWIVAFQFPIAAFTTGTTILLRVFLKFKWSTWSTMTYEFSKLLMVASLFYAYSPDPVFVVFASIAADFVALLAMAPRSVRLYRSFASAPILVKESILAPLYGHGKWGVASAYLGSFANNIRPWLIKVTLGTEAVGLFAVAYGLIQHTFSLLPLASLIQPILPQYIERRELFYKVFHKFLKYQVLTAGVLAIAGLTIFPPIIAFLFPNYTPSLGIYQLMLFAFVPYAASPVIAGTYNALQLQKNLTASLLWRTMLTVVLLPALALTLGLWGVAVEFVVTMALYQFERYRRLRVQLSGLELTFREFVRFDEYDRMILDKVFGRLANLLGRIART